MPTNMRDVISKMPAKQQKKIEARAKELIAEELTLQELRRARKLTQVRVAKTLGVGQDQVSKIEKRSDLLLSTLRQYIEAMGGSLTLVAQFPDRKPLVLTGVAMADSFTPKARKRVSA